MNDLSSKKVFILAKRKNIPEALQALVQDLPKVLPPGWEAIRARVGWQEIFWFFFDLMMFAIFVFMFGTVLWAGDIARWWVAVLIFLVPAGLFLWWAWQNFVRWRWCPDVFLLFTPEYFVLRWRNKVALTPWEKISRVEILLPNSSWKSEIPAVLVATSGGDIIIPCSQMSGMLDDTTNPMIGTLAPWTVLWKKQAAYFNAGEKAIKNKIDEYLNKYK